MTSLGDIPGGDPGSADFPGQLTRMRAALLSRLVGKWASLAARAADLASEGVAPQAGDVFALDDDPEALYVSTGATVGDWVRLTPGVPYVMGQVQYPWGSTGRNSDLVTTTLPVGLFTARPAVVVSALNAYATSSPVGVTLCKNVSDDPSSEITLSSFLSYAYTVDAGSTIDAGRWRYGFFYAGVRT